MRCHQPPALGWPSSQSGRQEPGTRRDIGGCTPPAPEHTHRCHSVRPSPRIEGAWFGKQTRDGAGGSRQAQVSQARSAELSFHKHGRAHAGHAQGTQSCLGTEIRQESLGGLMVRLSYSHGHRSRLSSDLGGPWRPPPLGRTRRGRGVGTGVGSRCARLREDPPAPAGLSLQRGPAPRGGKCKVSLPLSGTCLKSSPGVGVASTRVCACVCA